MSDQPLSTGADGRNAKGQFAPGNRLGRGNPHHKKVAQLRSALVGRVSQRDIRQVVDKLVELAKGGDLAAIRELLDRTLGKPVALDLQPSQEMTVDRAVWAIVDVVNLLSRHVPSDRQAQFGHDLNRLIDDLSNQTENEDRTGRQ